MENPNERIKYLIIQHLRGELTIHEQLELQTWVDLSPDHLETFEQLSDPDRLKEEVKNYGEARANTWNKIEAGIEITRTPIVRPIRRMRAYMAAASLLLVIITGYFWLSSRFSSSEARPAQVPVAARDVAPGGSKATLTLADGSIITLENTTNGSLAKQGSAQVSKDRNSLSYTVAATEHSPNTAIVYNTLTTPRSGQFQVVLPDGTKVWLNNASSLKYPTSFTGSGREVELTGEGYFEVASNASQPFLVKAAGATVHVLGTSFNIMAYSNEPTINTTLVSGKIDVSQSGQHRLLKPGDQVRSDKEGNFKQSTADIAAVTAWKNGFFNFAHTDFEGVMRQLARWYDIDVIYKGKIPDKTFFGVLDRQLSLAAVLKILESEEYNLAIEGKSIIVSSNVK